MDEEFVKKVLGQATDGLIDMHDINEIWRVYKRRAIEAHPDIHALIEKDELLMKKVFLSSIDMFMAVPHFLTFMGISKTQAAMSMFRLERSMKEEYSEVLKAERK